MRVQSLSANNYQNYQQKTNFGERLISIENLRIPKELYEPWDFFKLLKELCGEIDAKKIFTDNGLIPEETIILISQSIKRSANTHLKNMTPMDGANEITHHDYFIKTVIDNAKQNSIDTVVETVKDIAKATYRDYKSKGEDKVIGGDYLTALKELLQSKNPFDDQDNFNIVFNRMTISHAAVKGKSTPNNGFWARFTKK